MYSTNITRNFLNPIKPLNGTARPLCRARLNQFPSYKTRFLGVPVPIPVQSVGPSTRPSTINQNLLIITNQAKPNKSDNRKYVLSPPCIDNFSLKFAYLDPTDALLFSAADIAGAAHELIDPLGLNLNPNDDNSNSTFDTIQQAIANESLVLDLTGLRDIFIGKIFNPRHHLSLFVTGFGAINFEKYKLAGVDKKSVFAWETSVLKADMEEIRNLYALIYLGFALDILIHDQPQHIYKKNYKVQRYIRNQDILADIPVNANNFSYSLVYERQLNFCLRGKSHRLTVRCIFNIFRIVIEDGVKTYINLNSFYPLGNPNVTEFELWRHDMTSSTALSMINSPESIKFNDMLNILKGSDICSLLNEIYPDLQLNEERKTDIKTKLGINSLNSKNLMRWPQHLIQI